jgi:hypothetical protein
MRGARPATVWCRSSARADRAGNATLLPPRYWPVRVLRAPTRSYSTLLRCRISYGHTRQWRKRRRRRQSGQSRCEARQTAARRARAASTRSASSTALSACISTRGAKAMLAPFDNCRLQLLARDVRLWWPRCSVNRFENFLNLVGSADAKSFSVLHHIPPTTHTRQASSSDASLA